MCRITVISRSCWTDEHSKNKFWCYSQCTVHCVSKICPTYDLLYNLDIHNPVALIFGRTVTKKVRNQMMLCFPTSPVQCFCITLQNRKPRNCIFSLLRCMLLCQQTHKTHSDYHLVTVEPTFIPKVIDCMPQIIKTYLEREYSILSFCLLLTRSVLTKSVTMSVAV